ncbi:lytic transglycosylase domain-containing protein [Acidovorax sp. LjRoot129]|uniref:lytic transglycosylase domain-containing protein n=1 Tax=Acidovorax sp. LjRoot129 TaxID=3342260 RepID=UPI003ECEA9AF
MDFTALAQQCAPAVHPQTLAAIVKIESGFRPFAIGINKGTAVLKRQPENKEEAVVAAKKLIAGGHNIDMGLGQINSDNLPRLGITVEDVFDPCKNLAAAAAILTDNYTRAATRTAEPQTALNKALSAYNTGDFIRGLKNGYVFRVAQANQELTRGYTVPAIKSAPQTVAPATNDIKPLVLTATPAAPQRANLQPKPQLQQDTADPALVFGNPTAGGEGEASRAMVF